MPPEKWPVKKKAGQKGEVRIYPLLILPVGFPGGAVVKNPLTSAGDARDVSSIPGLGWSPGVGNAT